MGPPTTCFLDATPRRDYVLRATSDQNNYANQMNPSHPAYWKSRNQPMPAEIQRVIEKAARRKLHAGNFEKRANNLAPKDNVDGQTVDFFLRCLREVCGGSSGIRRKG